MRAVFCLELDAKTVAEHLVERSGDRAVLAALVVARRAANTRRAVKYREIGDNDVADYCERGDRLADAIEALLREGL